MDKKVDITMIMNHCKGAWHPEYDPLTDEFYYYEQNLRHQAGLPPLPEVEEPVNPLQEKLVDDHDLDPDEIALYKRFPELRPVWRRLPRKKGGFKWRTVYPKSYKPRPNSAYPPFNPPNLGLGDSVQTNSGGTTGSIGREDGVMSYQEVMDSWDYFKGM